MRILLHIGQSKTGTSAIQSFLTKNRMRLRDMGILYPMIRNNGVAVELGNHNAVADAVVGKYSFPFLSAKEYFDSFFGEASDYDPDIMILSAEHFIAGHPRMWDVRDESDYFDKYEEKVRAIRKHLRGCEVELFAYLRPQVDWMSSTVSQTVRVEGLSGSGSFYRSDRQLFHAAKPLLRYHRVIETWDKLLSPESITIVPYERASLKDGDSLVDFLNRLGLGDCYANWPGIRSEVNQSMSREFIEVKKLLNRIPKDKPTERAVIKCLECLSRGVTRIPYRISDQLADEIITFVEPENEKINSDYVSSSSPLCAVTRSYLESEVPDVTREDIQRAKRAFRLEFRKPQFRVMVLAEALKDALRTKYPPVHSMLRLYKFRIYPTLGLSGDSDYAASSTAVSSSFGMIDGSFFRPMASRNA